MNAIERIEQTFVTGKHATFCYIYPHVVLSDFSLVAVSAWDFVDILVFQVDIPLCAG